MPLINLNVFHTHRHQVKADKKKTFTTKKDVECSHTFEQIENFLDIGSLSRL